MTWSPMMLIGYCRPLWEDDNPASWAYGLVSVQGRNQRYTGAQAKSRAYKASPLYQCDMLISETCKDHMLFGTCSYIAAPRIWCLGEVGKVTLDLGRHQSQHFPYRPARYHEGTGIDELMHLPCSLGLHEECHWIRKSRCEEAARNIITLV